jgi:predicted MFS family arabinose efflux permease
VIFAVIALIARRFSLPVVLVLAALDGMVAIAAKALIRSVNAAVLGTPELLRQGNAVINMGAMVGGAIGPALAGLLVAAAGPSSALALDAASFVVCALLVATAHGLRASDDHHATAFGRLRAGLREVSLHPAPRRLLVATALALLFGAAVIPIEVVFAKHTLHAGDSGYGFLIGAWGVGLTIGGAVFAGGSRYRLSAFIGAGVGMIAAGYAGLAASPDLLVACLFSALGGIGNGIWWVAVVTALQQAIPSNAQAAVMAVLESVNQVMPALGFIIGGVITALSSPRMAYAVAAAGVAVVLIAQIWPRRKDRAQPGSATDRPARPDAVSAD